MKELLSKKFWQDVKKTFEEAQKSAPPANAEPAALAPKNAEEASTEVPPASTASNENSHEI